MSSTASWKFYLNDLRKDTPVEPNKIVTIPKPDPSRSDYFTPEGVEQGQSFVKDTYWKAVKVGECDHKRAVEIVYERLEDAILAGADHSFIAGAKLALAEPRFADHAPKPKPPIDVIASVKALLNHVGVNPESIPAILVEVQKAVDISAGQEFVRDLYARKLVAYPGDVEKAWRKTANRLDERVDLYLPKCSQAWIDSAVATLESLPRG